MARRHARRQIGKEWRDFGGNAEILIGDAHAAEILIAGLLRDGKPRAQTRV